MGGRGRVGKTEKEGVRSQVDDPRSTTVATWSKQVARTVSENSRFRRGLILMVVFGGAQRKRSIPGDYHTIDS